MIGKLLRPAFLLLSALSILVGCTDQTAVPQSNYTNYLAERKNGPGNISRPFLICSTASAFFIPKLEPRTDFEIPRNREQINAGNFSRFPNLRTRALLYVAYPDIPIQSTSDSYLEILKSGKHVHATITVAEGYGFVVIEPADELELSVIYCLPAELSEIGETDKRCFSSIGFLEVGESPWPGH